MSKFQYFTDRGAVGVNKFKDFGLDASAEFSAKKDAIINLKYIINEAVV